MQNKILAIPSVTARTALGKAPWNGAIIPERELSFYLFLRAGVQV